MEKADCHCHTVHSDGTLSAVALLDKAKENQVTGLSITDHDTIAAYKHALPYAAQIGIKLISGIEISTELQKTPIHVLGYAFDLAHPTLHAFCQKLQAARTARNLQILEKLQKLKMPLTLEELAIRYPDSTIGRPHIAKALVAKGWVKSSKEAFTRFLGDKRRCYVSGLQVCVEQAIELIHQAGGYAVLAHPHYIQPKTLIQVLQALPFDGIEAYYGRLNLTQIQPWLALAKEKNWLITGGSDFHGAKKSLHSLGCAWTPPENFTLLVKRFEEHTAKLKVSSSLSS